MSHKGAPGTKVKKAFLTLVVLALLAVALQSLVFSGASFTATKGNPGKLSDVLTVKIMDGSTTVYNGAIKSVGTVALPSAATPSTLPWAAGEAHTYTFTVTFPDGGTPGSATTGDNAFKGSSMSIEFDWTGTSN